MIDVQLVTAPAGVTLFAALPRQLYRGMSGYVPPLDIIQRDLMAPSKNPFFAHAEAAFWVASSGGQPVGRISAQVDTLENADGNVRTGHFGNLAAIDDAKVVAALFEAAERSLPTGRAGRPEDIADAVTFLAGKGFATGSVVDVDGGARIARAGCGRPS